MPKLTRAVDACFKKTMLPRAPACVFTDDDVDSIIAETGMDKKCIQNWACCLRWRMSIKGFPGSMSVEEFLQASDKSLLEKVM